MRSLLLALLSTLAPLALSAATAATTDPLNQVCKSVWFHPGSKIADVFHSLGRDYNVIFVLDADVTGTADADIPNGHTLKDVLNAICYPHDYYYVEQNGEVFVHHLRTEIFEVAAPSNTRTSDFSTVITLTGNNNGSSGNNNGSMGTYGSALTSTTTNGQSAAGGQNGGSSNIEVQEHNKADLWKSITDDLNYYLAGHPDDKVQIDPRTAKVIVTTTTRRLPLYSAYIRDLNHTLLRQVDIHAQIIQVTTSSQSSLGVNLQLAAVKAGALTISSGSTATAITNIGSQSLDPTSFATTIATGKVQAFITALEEQGHVRSLNDPQVRALNNEMAYLVVGQQEAFFSLAASQSVNNTTTNTSTSEQDIYQQQMLTFGTIFTVVPHIYKNFAILDVHPERNTLTGTKTSPDGKQQSPITDVQKAGTRLLMHDGETVVFAGLSSSESGSSTRGTPFISHIPLLGDLFKTKAAAATRSDLVIILTIHIHDLPRAAVLPTSS